MPLFSGLLSAGEQTNMRFVELTVLPIIWGAVPLAVLSVHDSNALNQHTVCGVWGCGPPLNALVAVHVGWIAALWPPLFYLPWRLKTTDETNKWLAIALITAGIAGIAGIVLWQWFVWLPRASEFAAEHIWQRCAFSVATAGDWPLAQLLAGGLVLLIVRRCRPYARQKDRSPAHIFPEYSVDSR